MIIVMEPKASLENINKVVKILEEHGFKFVVNKGETIAFIG